MLPQTLKPVVRTWAVGGCLSLAVGLFATAWAVVAGPHDVADAVIYSIGFSVLITGFTIGPSLKKMEAPETAPADAALQANSRPGAWALMQFAVLVLLLVAAAVLRGAMLWVGCVGLAHGFVWLTAAGVVQYRERRWFHGRLAAGKRTSRFRPSTTPYYLIPEAKHSAP